MSGRGPAGRAGGGRPGRRPRPELDAEVVVDRERLVDDEVTVELSRAAARVERLEVPLVVPPAWRALDRATRTWATAVALAAGEE